MLLPAPLFIFQWQFDKFQLYADNVQVPASPDQWNYIHKLGSNLRNTFQNVSAVFSPSCIAHEVITKSHWSSIAVNEVTLPDAIACWAESLPSELSEDFAKGKSNFGHHGLEIRAQVSEKFLEDNNEIVVSQPYYNRLDARQTFSMIFMASYLTSPKP